MGNVAIKEISVVSNSPARDIQEFNRYCERYIDKCKSDKIYLKDGVVLKFYSYYDMVGIKKYYLYHEVFETYLKRIIIDLQEENEKLRKNQRLTPEQRQHLHLELDEVFDDCKSRIDKAIQFNQIVLDSDYVYSQDEIASHNLEILQGSDNFEKENNQ